jgi:hypothetical protein
MSSFRRGVSLVLLLLFGVAHPLGWAGVVWPSNVSRERMAARSRFSIQPLENSLPFSVTGRTSSKVRPGAAMMAARW